MKRILVALTLLASVLTIHAQERRVQNRPYTDLRDFHFGVLVGTHLQDLELNNVGPQMVDLDDGNGVVQKPIKTVGMQDLQWVYWVSCDSTLPFSCVWLQLCTLALDI